MNYGAHQNMVRMALAIVANGLPQSLIDEAHDVYIRGIGTSADGHDFSSFPHFCVPTPEPGVPINKMKFRR